MTTTKQASKAKTKKTFQDNYSLFFNRTNLDICPGDLDVAPGARLHAPWRVFNDFHQVMVGVDAFKFFFLT